MKFPVNVSACAVFLLCHQQVHDIKVISSKFLTARTNHLSRFPQDFVIPFNKGNVLYWIIPCGSVRGISLSFDWMDNLQGVSIRAFYFQFIPF